MLRLKLLDSSLCLTQVYDPNSNAHNREFVERTSDALRKVMNPWEFGTVRKGVENYSPIPTWQSAT